MSTLIQLERSVSARVVANGAAIRIVTDILSRAGQMLAQRILERAYRKAEKKLMELNGRMLRGIGVRRVKEGDDSWVVRHWEGALPLWQSYWLAGLLFEISSRKRIIRAPTVEAGKVGAARRSHRQRLRPRTPPPLPVHRLLRP